MMTKRQPAVLGLLAATLAGCMTSPAEYATSLSPQDPKYRSPQCAQARSAAANYEANEKQTMSFATGLLFGPYGVGIAAAGKQHRERQRKLFVRDMHERCSSQPLPANLRSIAPAVQ